MTMTTINPVENLFDTSGERRLLQSHKTSFTILVTQAGDQYRLYLHSPSNQPGILYTISALLYIHDINIIEALAKTSPEGEVVDSFLLEPVYETGRTTFSGRKLRNMIFDLERLLTGSENVVQYLRSYSSKWKALTSARKMVGVELQVEPVMFPVAEERTGILPKEACWSITFSAGDRPGLLYELTKTLYLLYFDVLELESTTSGTQAMDRLIVRRTTGHEGSSDGEILMEALASFS